MGSISTNGKCLITGIEAQDRNMNNSNWEGYEYSIETKSGKQIFSVPPAAKGWNDIDYFKMNKHIIIGLILNGNFKKYQTIVIPDFIYFQELLESRIYPKTPQEKLEFLFLDIIESTKFFGEDISYNWDETLAYRFYMHGTKELKFFLNTLQDEGFIDLQITSTNAHVKVTYLGLNHGISIKQEGYNSNYCFVAMSFSDDSEELRSAIKEACAETGYNPILVDEVVIDSHQTINDSIISNLRQCKFCISDFSEQKMGVYFEAGFALGQGKKVIYTCHKEWFDGTKGESHFDTNHFPHLIYKSPKELREKLIDRIRAWM